MRKKSILDLSIDELKEQLEDLKEPSYRAQQIFSWLYKKRMYSFDDMRNLPAPLRERLKTVYNITPLRLSRHLKSKDKSEKFVFELQDDRFIETVLIPSKKRNTVCLSTQVGCRYGCIYCASGLKGFVRDLRPSEITAQVLFLQREFNIHITNIVLMGMGEPLDNFLSVSKAIGIMNSPEAMGIAARKITVSTCGIVPGIEKVSRLGLQVNLSISLHAGDDRLRSRLMPINKRYPLKLLTSACEDYFKKTNRRITLEYVLVKDLNDSLRDANGLSAIARRLKAQVNIIPYSRVASLEFDPPLQKDVKAFKTNLQRKGVNVTVRESKGSDISAACGQLALP